MAKLWYKTMKKRSEFGTPEFGRLSSRSLPLHYLLRRRLFRLTISHDHILFWIRLGNNHVLVLGIGPLSASVRLNRSPLATYLLLPASTSFSTPSSLLSGSNSTTHRLRHQPTSWCWRRARRMIGADPNLTVLRQIQREKFILIPLIKNQEKNEKKKPLKISVASSKIRFDKLTL